MNRSHWYLLAALLLAGCASVPAPPSTRPAVPEASPAVPQETQPQSAMPQSPVVIEPAPQPLISGNKAVIALLDRARHDNEAGQREAAGVALERALRIEPRNAWLWNELAQLRLTQGQYAQAITLARKSSSFAGRDRVLQALNWKVIGNARVAQGDATGAEQAFKQAADLEQTTRMETEHAY